MGLLESVLASLAQGQGGGVPSPAARGGGADLQGLLMQVVAAMLAGGGPGAGASAAPGAGLGGAGGAGLGGLGAVLGSVLGGGAAPAGGGMAGAGLGGLGELMQQFQRAGMGDVLNSWIGTGQNASIAPDQLGQVLGDDFVTGLANRTGVPQDDLLGQLSQLLPQMIDRATPEGRVPDGGLGDIGAILARFEQR
jgi:uncharacterized protein YidB (DUF937 family)